MRDIREYTKGNNQYEEGSVDIRQQIEQYGYYWKWIVLSVILAMGVAYVSLYATGIYHSSPKVMVLDQANASIELTALGDLTPLSLNTALDDQIQIIRSSKLRHEVVRKNKFYITYAEVGRVHGREVLAVELHYRLQILK